MSNPRSVKSVTFSSSSGTITYLKFVDGRANGQLVACRRTIVVLTLFVNRSTVFVFVIVNTFYNGLKLTSTEKASFSPEVCKILQSVGYQRLLGVILAGFRRLRENRPVLGNR